MSNYEIYNKDRITRYLEALQPTHNTFDPEYRDIGDGIEVIAPSQWSDNAVRIAYTRWAYKGENVHESSIFAMCFRIAYALAHRGHSLGYFDTEEEAIAFCNTLFTAFLDQEWFPNSPQWFNTGIYDVYGILGEDCGLWRVPDGATEADPVLFRYLHPQVSACFIQSIEDSLTEGNGILPLVQDEARLFKMGSGTGTNFSALRGKDAPLSNGGHSSGLISFLNIGDANAGAIKSGGTTRRAAKMVLLDVTHPDILEFVEWKIREEDKIAQMAWASSQIQGKTPEELLALGLAKPLVDRIRLGHVPNLLDLDFNGEAVRTVSGQNSNNSIRIPDRFFEVLDANGDWNLICPNTNETVATIPAKKLWHTICLSAWACGDPGVQFIDTINAANPCPNSGAINASNPCSEYLYLDDTSCNLASVNLIKFLCPHTNRILWEKLRKTAKTVTVALDISVSIAAFPSKRIAEGTWAHRTLGLGYSNLGGLLMAMGVPYDSVRGREIAAEITQKMMQSAQAESGRLAGILGSFPAFALNEDRCESVMYHQVGEWNMIGHEGFRNAQHMVIAPCGTIGLGMDCDTLGVEPALGLMTYKKLADTDEVMRIPNRLVGAALEALKIDEDLIEEFEDGLRKFEGNFYDALAHARLEDRREDLEKVLATSLGTPNIPWEAHIKMLAAIQPHVSGGISKTINMPEDSTVEDVSRAYRMAHDLGVKCVAIFRNGCKDAPYSVSSTPTPVVTEEPQSQTVTGWGRRKEPARLTDDSVHLNATIAGGPTVRVTVNRYPDTGSPSEVFVEMGDSGSTLNSLIDTVARLSSKCLQLGLDPEEIMSILAGAKFEPSGLAQGPWEGAKFVNSPLSVVAKALDIATTSTRPKGVATVTPIYSTEISTPVEYLQQCPRPSCRSFNVVPSGTCHVCGDCGESIGGCS